MKKPNLFVVGAPKCGTTSLCAYLGQHPDIFMSEPKEPFFFGTDFTGKPRPYSLERYLALFENAENQRFIAEGTTWYLCSKTAASEIKNFSPDAKIVVMLRRPADLLESLFNFRVFTGREDIETLDQAFDLEASRLAGATLPVGTDLSREQFAYSEVIRFGTQIGRFVEAFGRENVHIILYDDFKKDTEGAFDKTLQFLGLQPVGAFQKFEIHNKGRRNRSNFLKKFINNPPSWLKGPARLFSKDMRRKIYRWLVKANSAEAEKKDVKISPELKRRLAPLIATELAEIERVTGRDLSHWKFQEG